LGWHPQLFQHSKTVYLGRLSHGVLYIDRKFRWSQPRGQYLVDAFKTTFPPHRHKFTPFTCFRILLKFH
jgi:hypothetical protein